VAEEPTWSRVQEVLQAALDEPAETRGQFVREMCRDDEILFAEVQSLLVAHDRAGDFAERPALCRLADGPTATDDLATHHPLLSPGDRLGPYEIRSFIGAGGMGEVYRAIDIRLDRVVAVKVLPWRAERPDLRERFEREARTIAGLLHPNICVLHDVGAEGPLEYLVMEYVEGETMATRIARGSLSIEDAVRYATDIAKALAEIHRHGIVHRDVKPSNIMLTSDGAKLLDFGIAKLRFASPMAADQTSGGERSPAVSSLLGTPQYMAPEQLQGKDVDRRSDIFSFGAVLYEMISGRKAFPVDIVLNTIAAITEHDPRPVSTLTVPDVEAVDRLVRRCLAKDPEYRWQNADQLVDALRNISNSTRPASAPAVVSLDAEQSKGGLSAPATIGPLRRRYRATALVTAGLLLIGLALSRTGSLDIVVLAPAGSRSDARPERFPVEGQSGPSNSRQTERTAPEPSPTSHATPASVPATDSRDAAQSDVAGGGEARSDEPGSASPSVTVAASPVGPGLSPTAPPTSPLVTGAPTESLPSFIADDAIVLNVTATDASGRHVTDLDQRAFSIFEDGIAQDVSFLVRGPRPVAVSLLIESSESMQKDLPALQAAVASFIARVRPNDVAQIIDFDGRVVRGEFTADRAELESAVHATAPGGTRSTHNAIYIALQALRRMPIVTPEGIRRRTLVVFSKGPDTSSLVSPEEVLSMARNAETTIHTIELVDAGTDESARRSPGSVFQQLADVTGGRSFYLERPEDLTSVYARIRNELDSQYTLAYRSKNPTRNGAWRRITVKVSPSDVRARTRQGYYAPRR
jgi:VWFA-related protein